ncbi:hypothetical protein AK812_SmicGene33294 [Symbiodinium microadriaticum]|uniref:Uncharacterized protein n=1 Tax=Symbiodinium microadriaticum TaxID=2951 RepID=A0A1Q9CRZ1_SYMMI|nr:hypothetical protein AK812_SmicGene33294 [Symbiodinium microadriaticum]
MPRLESFDVLLATISDSYTRGDGRTLVLKALTLASVQNWNMRRKAAAALANLPSRDKVVLFANNRSPENAVELQSAEYMSMAYFSGHDPVLFRRETDETLVWSWKVRTSITETNGHWPVTYDSCEYFYLVSVHLPFGWSDIKSAETKAQERDRKDIWNQIDVCVEGSFESPVEAARGAMGQFCGIEVSDVLWESKVQARIRTHAGAAAARARKKIKEGCLDVEMACPTVDDINPALPIIRPSCEDYLRSCVAVDERIKGVLCFSEVLRPAITPSRAVLSYSSLSCSLFH